MPSPRVRPLVVLAAALGLAATVLVAPASADPLDLAVGISAGSPVRVGQPFTLSVWVQDLGDADATDVAVDLDLAGGTAAPLPPSAGVAALRCTATRCVVDRLAAGEAAVVQLAVTLPTAGSRTLTARLAGADPATAATAVVDVLPPLPPAVLSLGPLPAVVVYGQQVVVTGRALRGDGTPADGGGLVLQRRPAGSATWTTVPADLVVRGGVVTLTLTADAPADYRLHDDGDAELYSGGTTAPTDGPVVELRPFVRAAVLADPVSLPPGGSGTLTARADGPTAGRTVLFQMFRDGAWRDYASRALSASGSASVPLRSLPAGTHRYRAVVAGADALPSPDRLLPVTASGAGDPRDAHFIDTDGRGRPVRWDPCRPVRFVVNASLAPPGGVADLTEALRRVSQASGLVFRSAGRTAYVPREPGEPGQPAPMVIAWVRPGTSVGGGIAGIGGVTYDGTRVTSGGVLLDSSLRLRAGFGAGPTEGALLLHELGHAVGLGHASTGSQIMYPSLSLDADATMWGAGDLTALHRVGRASGCLS